MVVSLFGFQISKKKPEIDETSNKTFALPNNDDGAVVLQSGGYGGGYYGSFVDLDGIVRNEVELITRYREMSIQPEMERAIDEITNEAIVMEEDGHSVDINMDDLKAPAGTKNKIKEEFKYIQKLLSFGNMGSDIFRRWYIDGRLFYHIIVDEKNLTDGIKEIRYIDPRRIRKIREIQKTRDQKTAIDVIKSEVEYYLYNERGILGAHSNLGAKISVDSIVNVNSGIMDSRRTMVLSFLHSAIKPLNLERMMTDATVIYKISRAPERRIFYIDVGQMSSINAEQYLKDIMTKYRNKLVYNSATGEIKNDIAHRSMLEDIFVPRREGGKGTEITTLPGGQSLGSNQDLDYFKQKLYESLHVPISRLQPSTGFSLGRATEITRDELNFHKFIQKIRNKFSTLFDELLRRQLVLKNICTDEDWDTFKEDIWYDFKSDNNFDELKEAELLTNRLNMLAQADPFVGRYFSLAWVRKNIMHFTDEDIKELDKEIREETPPAMVDPNGFPVGQDSGAAGSSPPQLQGSIPQLAAPGGSNGASKEKPNRFVNDTMVPYQ